MRFRPNVAAILQRDGRILIGERVDVPNAWQFPQGGVDRGESAPQALQRELWEELSLRPTDYRIIEQRGPYRYTFDGGRTKKRFHGQEQQYFLAEMLASDSAIDVSTKKPEFRRVAWIEPAQFNLLWLPRMKREVYRAVLHDFFGVRI
jgi:putative (di)nucleoside polyphosphate hydrolase